MLFENSLIKVVPQHIDMMPAAEYSFSLFYITYMQMYAYIFPIFITYMQSLLELLMSVAVCVWVCVCKKEKSEAALNRFCHEDTLHMYFTEQSL